LKALRGWPGLRAVAVAFGLGVLVALGQAPVGAWFVAVPALAALLWWIVRQDGGRVWAALFGGVGYFGASLSWIVEPFLIDVARHGWMAPFALVMMAFGLALFWAAAAAAGGRRVWVLAVALAVAELARGYVLTGFPWALIGHVWIDTPLAQGAAVVGPSGVTLLTLLAAAGLTQWRLAPLGVGGLAAVWGFGVWQLAQPAPAPPGITLRLVQPNAEQAAKWDADKAQLWFDRLLAYTAVQPAPDLVIWPETALPYLIEQHPELPGLIAAAGGGATVALGRQRIEGPRGWNSLTVIGPDAQIVAEYDKHHLVPFGEYLPLGDLAYRWFGLRAFAAQEGNGYSAGPGPRVLDLGPLGRVVPLICYEAVFPQDLRTAERPDWLLQVTNDAWFGQWTGPFQHLAQARLRAIEQGLPMARVANTGVTAMIDARGRIVDALPFGVAGYLDVALPGGLPITPYARWGEVPVLFILTTLLALALRRRPVLDGPRQTD